MTADPKIISPERQAAGANESSNGRPTMSAASADHRAARSGAYIWLRRLAALLFVTVCATFGVLLLILPWTPKWTDNPLLLTSPQLRHVMASGFVRGLTSGVGLLDLWLGFWEAVHYHETESE